jgi:hypothetical protein
VAGSGVTGLSASAVRPGQLASLDALAAIPEEEIWLASQKSARTRRAYRQDVAHFMRTYSITAPEQLRQVDHCAVIAWERIMREQEGAAASTVRRPLAALSSLFNKIVGDSALELEMAGFLDGCGDIVSFVKNSRSTNFRIEYQDANGSIANYYPDFVVKREEAEI